MSLKNNQLDNLPETVQKGLALSKLSNKLSELQNTSALPRVAAIRNGTAISNA